MRVTGGQRFAVFERDGFRCVYCGKNGAEAELQIDHVVAVSRGGVRKYSNLVTACKECNHGKSDRTVKATYAGILDRAARPVSPSAPHLDSSAKKGHRRGRPPIPRADSSSPLVSVSVGMTKEMIAGMPPRGKRGAYIREAVAEKQQRDAHGAL